MGESWSLALTSFVAFAHFAFAFVHLAFAAFAAAVAVVAVVSVVAVLLVAAPSLPLEWQHSRPNPHFGFASPRQLFCPAARPWLAFGLPVLPQSEEYCLRDGVQGTDLG